MTKYRKINPNSLYYVYSWRDPPIYNIISLTTKLFSLFNRLRDCTESQLRYLIDNIFVARLIYSMILTTLST